MDCGDDDGDLEALRQAALLSMRRKQSISTAEEAISTVLDTRSGAEDDPEEEEYVPCNSISQLVDVGIDDEPYSPSRPGLAHTGANGVYVPSSGGRVPSASVGSSGSGGAAGGDEEELRRVALRSRPSSSSIGSRDTRSSPRIDSRETRSSLCIGSRETRKSSDRKSEVSSRAEDGEVDLLYGDLNFNVLNEFADIKAPATPEPKGRKPARNEVKPFIHNQRPSVKESQRSVSASGGEHAVVKTSASATGHSGEQLTVTVARNKANVSAPLVVDTRSLKPTGEQWPGMAARNAARFGAAGNVPGWLPPPPVIPPGMFPYHPLAALQSQLHQQSHAVQALTVIATEERRRSSQRRSPRRSQDDDRRRRPESSRRPHDSYYSSSTSSHRRYRSRSRSRDDARSYRTAPEHDRRRHHSSSYRRPSRSPPRHRRASRSPLRHADDRWRSGDRDYRYRSDNDDRRGSLNHSDVEQSSRSGERQHSHQSKKHKHKHSRRHHVCSRHRSQHDCDGSDDQDHGGDNRHRHADDQDRGGDHRDHRADGQAPSASHPPSRDRSRSPRTKRKKRRQFRRRSKSSSSSSSSSGPSRGEGDSDQADDDDVRDAKYLSGDVAERLHRLSSPTGSASAQSSRAASSRSHSIGSVSARSSHDASNRSRSIGSVSARSSHDACNQSHFPDSAPASPHPSPSPSSPQRCRGEDTAQSEKLAGDLETDNQVVVQVLASSASDSSASDSSGQEEADKGEGEGSDNNAPPVVFTQPLAMSPPRNYRRRVRQVGALQSSVRRVYHKHNGAR